MADLLAILIQGATSLGAQRAAAATASHNLENVNTPGYARQNADLEAALPAEQEGRAYLGGGAELQTVSQVRDRFLEAQLPAALGASAQADAQSQALSAMTGLDPDQSNGVGSALSGFFTALRSLSQNPGSSVLRQGAVDSASQLALSFQTAAGSVTSARDGLDDQIGGQVTQVNQLTQQMASLNQQIRAARAQAQGAEPNDLLDARQGLQDQISELTGATPVTDGAGDVSMVLASGLALVSEDHAATLSAQPDPANGGHLTLSATLPDGTGPVAVASSALGGSIGGELAARDGALAQAGSSLDTLAFDLGNALNAVHSAGFALDGSTGHNLFTVGATAAGAAASIAVDPAVAANPSLLSCASTAAGVPGDASNAFALVDVESQALSGGQSAEGTLAQITATFGAAASGASALSDQEDAVKSQLVQLRESASGVSSDDETVKLTAAQSAYQAVSKVISAADEMLQTLMAIT